MDEKMIALLKASKREYEQEMKQRGIDAGRDFVNDAEWSDLAFFDQTDGVIFDHATDWPVDLEEFYPDVANEEFFLIGFVEGVRAVKAEFRASLRRAYMWFEKNGKRMSIVARRTGNAWEARMDKYMPMSEVGTGPREYVLAKAVEVFERDGWK